MVRTAVVNSQVTGYVISKSHSPCISQCVCARVDGKVLSQLLSPILCLGLTKF